VTNLNDTGSGSLRDAIATTPPGGTVDFQTGLAGTITLTTGELAIIKDLTIAGPGANVIKVSANGQSRVFNIPSRSNVALSDLMIADGFASTGGGISSFAVLTVSGCVLTNNRTPPGGGSGGGGIYNEGATVVVRHSTFTGNSSEQGGAIINNSGTLTVSDSTFSNNSAGVGGAISSVFPSANVTIVRSTLTGNHANYPVGLAGGGIANNLGMIEVIDSNISGNSAGNETGGNGGGIFNQDGVLMLENTTLSDNSAPMGAGISNWAATSISTVTISNNTLFGNTGDHGGAIATYGSNAIVTLHNATVSGNTGTQSGGGVYLNNGGRVYSKDTIIARNVSSIGPDVAGALFSQGHNLIGNGTGGSGYDSTDLVGTSNDPIDPKLGPLQNNGGRTETMALLSGSPAIDAGDNTGAPKWDQRGHGFPRIVNGIIDIGAFEVQEVSSPFVVTNTNDFGPGSLRQVIMDADNSSDPVTITFAIPGTGPRTIRPESPLPVITHPLLLDGTSQPGYAGQPLIVLDGSALGDSADGLTISAGDTTVMGLVIDSFPDAGIHLESVGGDVVTGNYLGTDATGTQSLGNRTGVWIDDTSDNVIGGITTDSANLISGNRREGIFISGSDNVVQDNRIGTDISGTAAVPNGAGVWIIDKGSDNLIGGSDPGAGNLISGNRRDGVAIEGGAGNFVQGNLIGADASGRSALPNDVGIELLSNSVASIIGGTARGAGNIISGNGRDGVAIYSDANVLAGNYIGTDASGTLDLGNGQNGVGIFGDIHGFGNTIGGTARGAGNVIAYNGNDGVLVDVGTSNAIRQNSIFGNQNLGIELSRHGNQDQAAPELDSATSDGSTTTVVGTLTSLPNTSFTLEFFATPDSGPGQGERFLGSIIVTTNPNGQARFTALLGVGVDEGQFVTATATDPDSNTSEFSMAVEVTGPNAPVWLRSTLSTAVQPVLSPADAQTYTPDFSPDNTIQQGCEDFNGALCSDFAVTNTNGSGPALVDQAFMNDDPGADPLTVTF
jgi:hypothetical protein